MLRLTIIVAATKSNGIGQNAGLPWRLPLEMKYFAQVTTTASEGTINAVLMGRNTWESIPKKYRPLPRRANFVTSRNTDYVLESSADAPSYLHTNLASALQQIDSSQSFHRTFIIGGASLYAETLALTTASSAVVDRILLTRILTDFDDCDVFMADFLKEGETAGSDKFPTVAFLRLASACTVGLTLPALLWFAAITLSSVSDVTAIWNTNAFFAYVITVKLFKLKWQPRRLLAVLLATFGVIVVVYGGSTSDGAEPSTQASFRKPLAPLVGDLLTLVASVGFGLYQVLYKKYAALSTDPEVMYDQVPSEDHEPPQSDENPLLNADRMNGPSTPPFGLPTNFLTSIIGLLTFITLWLPIPFLHYAGVEPFRPPPNFTTILAISGISLSGIVYNASFMVLLGIWGPIIVSVGNLLTIVLVFISDILFGAGTEGITLWSVVGCSVIVTAFSVLAYDMS
ncbi:hypothetical protein H0H92_004087, partial [Tricholoma furcatifolium]